MDHIKQIAQKLPAFQLDAMLLTSPANRFYAMGFPSSEGMALITSDKSFFFTDARYIEAAQAAIAKAQVERIDGKRGYLACLQETVAALGVKRLGLEEREISLAFYKNYSEQVPCEWIPAQGLMDGLRAVKDRAELDRMEAAQRVAEQALELVLPRIGPDVTEQEVAAQLTYQMLRLGAERMSFDPIVVSGPNSSRPHGTFTGKKLTDGAFLMMDFGCVLQGYCSDMTRTVAVGHATQEMRQVYAVVLAAQSRVLQEAKAGMTGAQIDVLARDVIEEAGYGSYFGHSLGHGLGIEIHETPNASPANQAPMPVGAVISVEPGIYLPGRFGVRIEDVIRLTAEGCTNLTRFPRELLIV